MQSTGFINEANEALKSPRLRARYLLTLKGVEFDDEIDTTSDGMFLMQQMEWREELAEVSEQADPLSALESLEDEINQATKKDVEQLTSLLKSEQDEANLKAADVIRQLKFLNKMMAEIGGFIDVEDSRPLPSIEWRLKVNREKAAQYGADVTLLGNTVKMLTNGILLAEYRPDDAEEELEIRLRFPAEDRNLEQLGRMRVPSIHGPVPINNFVTFEQAQKTGIINRTDGNRVIMIKAGVQPDLLPDAQVNKMKAALSTQTLPDGITIKFKGQDEDMQESMVFLISAFLSAIFLMVVILVTQFNSFYQAALVLSAIIFSTAGVLIGLLLTGQAFGVVMGGIGVIALAGIVVNNNIVLIDTFNDLKNKGLPSKEAILRTGAQRMRPVLLTSVTTVLGLLPMVFALTIDITGRHISVGAPSAQWWTQLSSAIAGGLTFATILTLFLTPCLLIIGDNVSTWYQQRLTAKNSAT